MSAFPTEADRVRSLLVRGLLDGDILGDRVALRWADARVRRASRLLLAYDGMALLEEVQTSRQFGDLEYGLVRLAERGGAAPVLTELVL